MSIKTTTNIEVSLDTTEVTPTNTKDIITDNQHCVEIESNESIIEGSKQEYSIVGDGLYASISADEAPQWLVDIVDNVVSTSMLSSFDNYNDLVQEVRNAIDSIDVAANTYVEQINIQSLVDGIIASRLASLNATVDGNTATILDLDTALVNLDESFAQRVLDITASFNDTTDARITEISQARADGDEALAQQITALDASIQDTNSDVSGQASAISGLQTYVGLDGSSDPNGTGVLSRVSILEKQNDGVIEYTTGTYDVMIGVDVDDNTPDNNQLDTSQAPYSTWIAADTAAGTEETRAAHVGDVYIQYSDDGNGNRTYIKSYKFIKTAVDETSPYSTDIDGYTWALVADTDLQATYTIALEAKDLADNKRRVFTTQPTGPYDIGDLWVKAGTTVGDVTTPQTINVATASRTVGFLAADWELADEQAKDFIENTWEPESATIKNQIDGKIEYFFYESYTDITDATDEADALDIKDNDWNTQALKENAHGNIVYFKDTRNAYWYNSSIPEWLTVDNTDIYEALQDAASAQGAADGKISQFYAWSGTTAPADYTATITEAVYSTDANGNFLDANGDITTDSEEYIEIEAAIEETISGNNVQYWFKADSTLYYRDTPSWTAVPTASGTGDKYLSAGDLLTVFDPTDRDTTVYTFNGSTWDAAGPTSVISKSRFFTDLDNEVRGPNGIVATTANGIRLDSEAYTDDTVTTLRNSFAYNSALKIGETYYNTGFGLDASAVTQDPNADGTSASTAYDSEFWINAERFVLKSPSYPGVQAVFTVQASGISLGTEYTEATRNEPKGVYSSSKAYGKGDVVSYNNSSYVAMVDMTAEQNEVPGTNPLKWQLLAAQGVSPVVYEFQGNDTWPTNTNEAGADEHVFDSLFAGNVVVRVLAYDAEGGVNISLNGGTAVPFTRTLGDNTEEWYQFSFDNLVVGSNTLRFWSTTDDGGSIKQIAVSFAGASGLNGGSVDFFFIRSASEPTTLPSEGTDWRTDVTQVAAGAGDLWSIKEITPLGGGTPTYEGLRVIDAPIIRELSIYSTPSASAVAKPTTSTYNFTVDPSTSDPLTIDDTNWSRSVAGITTNGHKIYVSTALVTGNPTETDKAITWSEPSIYAQRQDGTSVTVTDNGNDTYTITDANGSITVSDGVSPEIPTVTNNNDGTFTINDGAGNTVIISAGKQISVQATHLNNNDPERYIKITGNDGISVSGRGHRLVILNPSDNSVEHNQTYDTYGTPTDVDAIVAEINAAANGKVIILSTYDATSCSQELRDALKTCGAPLSDTWTANRTAHAFIGTKGAGTNSGYEVITDASDEVAYVSATFTEAGVLPKGYTPLKGIDYFDGANGSFTSFVYKIGESVEGPVEGSFDGTTEVMPTERASDDPLGAGDSWTDTPTASETDIEWVSTTKYVPSLNSDTGVVTWTNTGWSTPSRFYRKGDQGNPGVSYTGTTEYYAKSSSGSTAPNRYSSETTINTEIWKTDPADAAVDSTNKYLWNFNRNAKSDGSFTDSTPFVLTQYVKDGKGISSITEAYQLHNSGTTAPTGTWSATIQSPTDTNPYLWNRTTIGYTEGSDTVIYTLIAVKGDSGTPADNYKEIFLYQNANSAPTSLPTNVQGFTAASGNSTAIGDWTVTASAATAPAHTYRINITVKQTNNAGDWAAVDSAWSGPVQVSAIDGNNASTYKEIFIYTNSTAAPSVPTTTAGYYSTTSGAVAIPVGDTTWTTAASAPPEGKFTWRSSLTLVNADSAGTWAASDTAWNGAVRLTGEVGPQGNSVKGDRGTAVLNHSARIPATGDTATAPGSVTAASLGTYWNTAAPTIYDGEIVGDTLILTNTHPTGGWTHIYEYTATGWASSTEFIVNGNMVVEGTLSAAAIGTGTLSADFIGGGYIATNSLEESPAPGTAPIGATYDGTIMDSKGIKVYDGGVLRVKLGDLS